MFVREMLGRYRKSENRRGRATRRWRNVKARRGKCNQGDDNDEAVVRWRRCTRKTAVEQVSYGAGRDH